MPTKLSAAQYLDRDYLEIRCRLLDIASAMDRMTRAQTAAAFNDDRLKKINDALRILSDNQPDRAERVQMVCSDSYDERWLTK